MNTNWFKLMVSFKMEKCCVFSEVILSSIIIENKLGYFGGAFKKFIFVELFWLKIEEYSEIKIMINIFLR